MSDRSVVLVAGPAGGGKSTWAAKLGRERHLPVISTDRFIDGDWGDVPGRVAEIAQGRDAFILEGVRAASAVYHNDWAGDVTELWWCDRGPGKTGKFCRGLEKRQRDLLRAMSRKLPKAQRPPEEKP